MTLLTQIQLRRDVAANWAAINPVLALGEVGLETDTGSARVGDGTSAWLSLTAAFKQVNFRTLTQLGTTPTSADIAQGPGALFTCSDNILRYINAAGTAFVAIDVVGLQAATSAAAASATAANSTASSAQTAAAAAVSTANAAQTAATAAVSTANNAIPLTQKAAANGVATLDGSSLIPAAQLPNPSSTTLGGVKSTTGTAHQFMTGISTVGAPVTAQPSSADLSDSGSLQRLVGVYGTTSALQAAFPAASNPGATALVGSAAPFTPYKSDGTTWNKEVLPAVIDAKQNVPLNWNGTTPALASSTNPIPAFGSNAFVYTGAGGATLDGQTYQTGDMAVWNGTVFICERLGGGYVGSYASTSALQTAFPAASNVDCDALVSGVLYKSNGTTWLKNITSADVGAASGVASLDSSGHALATESGALTGDVTRTAGTNVTVLQATAPALAQQPINFQTGTTYTLVAGDAGNAVDMANAASNTLTIPPNSSVAFPLYTVISVSQGGAGTTTIAPGSGVTINKPASRTLSISAQYETAFLQKVGTDTWRALVG